MSVRVERVAVIERGKGDEAWEFAATISHYVEETFGVEIAWGTQIGGTVGTLHWYADYESLAQLEEVLGRVLSDAGYSKLISDAADLFTGPAEDTIVYMM